MSDTIHVVLFCLSALLPRAVHTMTGSSSSRCITSEPRRNTPQAGWASPDQYGALATGLSKPLYLRPRDASSVDVELSRRSHLVFRVLEVPMISVCCKQSIWIF